MIRNIAAVWILSFFIMGITAPAVTALPRTHETRRTVMQQVSGVVGVVDENYIAIVYSKTESGAEQEMGFERPADLRLINRRNWSEIVEGEPVLAVYAQEEIHSETRNPDASLEKSMKVLSRRLQSLQFTEQDKTSLASGY